jgi:hypothetical protein
MQTCLEQSIIVFLVMAFPCVLARLGSVRTMGRSPHCLQQGFNWKVVETNTGLKITDAKSFVFVKPTS